MASVDTETYARAKALAVLDIKVDFISTFLG